MALTLQREQETGHRKLKAKNKKKNKRIKERKERKKKKDQTTERASR